MDNLIGLGAILLLAAIVFVGWAFLAAAAILYGLMLLSAAIYRACGGVDYRE